MIVAAVLAGLGFSGAGAVAQPLAVAPAATGHRELGIAAGGLIQYQSPAKRDAYLDAVRDLGATWLRFDFAWTNIQNSGPASYDWARYDALVAAARQRGIQILGMIGSTPTWARDGACAGDISCRPSDPARYGAFAGKVAAHFAPLGVHHWEIWNEPNLTQFFRPAPDANYYTKMLISADSAIHAADPGATVITGGLSPAASSAGGNYAPTDFVKAMYAAGAHGHFDALGHHPYCYEGSFDCTAKNASWSAWSQMASTSVSLRGLLASHSDGDKQLWATEFGAPTAGGSTAMSEAHQATLLLDGLRRFTNYSWSGPLFVYSLQDRGSNPADREDWFGVIRADGSRKPGFGALAAGLLAIRGGASAPSGSSPAATSTTSSASAAAAAEAARRASAEVGSMPRSAAEPTPVPVLARVSPVRGPLAGGTMVTLSGQFLAGTRVAVQFGGRSATDVQVLNTGQVRARAPRGAAAGSTTVTVTVDGVTAPEAGTYRYHSRPSWLKRLWRWATPA